MVHQRTGSLISFLRKGKENIRTFVTVINTRAVLRILEEVRFSVKTLQWAMWRSSCNKDLMTELLIHFYHSKCHCHVVDHMKFLNSLLWRHNGLDGVSNHRPYHWVLNRLFKRRSQKTSKLRVTGLCEGNSPVNSPHKGPVTRKMLPFDDVIMWGKWSVVLFPVDALKPGRPETW